MTKRTSGDRKSKIGNSKSEPDRVALLFLPSGTAGFVEKGRSVKECARALHVDIEGVCGEKAACGKCRIRIEEGSYEEYAIQSQKRHLSPVTPSERQFLTAEDEARGYRLACQAHILDSVAVFVPEESRIGKHVVVKEVRETPLTLKPAVKKYFVELPPATLEDARGDWERIADQLELRHELKDLAVDYHVLTTIPSVLREGRWEVTVSVWNDREVIRIEPGRVPVGYGVAVDIGTTTIAAYLCRLTDGDIVATTSMLNPQVVYGGDVMSRISHAVTHAEGLEELHRAVVDAVNHLIEEAAAQAGISQADITDMTVVANTCMHHLFLGIEPHNLGRSPFTPAVNHSLDIKARDIGPVRISPGAYIHILPIEAGFVGADNVGVLIAVTPYLQESVELIIDIGTNGELVLGNRERLLSSSCATGPAFEGAQIRHGMRAAPGAIEKIGIDRETKEVRFKVIGKKGWNTELQEAGARGICGSAIIDVVPQLLLAGVIDRTGRFNRQVASPRYREVEGQPEFVIAWSHETSTGRDIVVCQADIRAIQLAKGAMYAGAKIMMAAFGVEKVDRVILAGAFGTCIDKTSAALLGLFPDCDINEIHSVGNAAGEGARLALLNVDKRREAEEIARRVQYLELTLEPGFNRAFVEAMWIPHMKDPFPHLARLPENDRDG
jgi:uncharacterized 2Fe-2S/4Fe-4S cluster protein (DUF4445 family)